MPESKFQEICRNSIEAFELIDHLKSTLNSLKENKITLDNQLIEKVFNICQDYKFKREFINKKKNIFLIKKKLNKRKKFKKNKNENFKNELKNFLINENLFGGTKDLKDNFVEKIDSEIINKQQEILNNNLNELKQLRNKAICFSKLIKLRSSQQANISFDSTSNYNKLNELISIIEARQFKYDLEKKTLKTSKDMEYKMNYKSKINKYESIIKGNLFGNNNWKHDDKDRDEFEIFHNQADIKIENLIAIRTEWDHFISNSIQAESVPLTWVEPNPTPNEEWSQFLKE